MAEHERASERANGGPETAQNDIADETTAYQAVTGAQAGMYIFDSGRGAATHPAAGLIGGESAQGDNGGGAAAVPEEERSAGMLQVEPSTSGLQAAKSLKAQVHNAALQCLKQSGSMRARATWVRPRLHAPYVHSALRAREHRAHSSSHILRRRHARTHTSVTAPPKQEPDHSG